jgi:hypothetical protein
MNRNVLTFLLLLTSIWSNAQGIYSFFIGTGTVTSFGSFYTPALEGVLLKNMYPHVYLGVSADARFYSFVFHAEDMTGQTFSNPNYGNVAQINHNSLYLMGSPTIDISIGGREYIHLFADAGLGIALYTEENTHYISTAVGGHTIINDVNTSANRNLIIYHYEYGITEHIPIGRYWTLSLSQKYSILGRDLNSGWGFAPQLRTDYLCFGVGVSHSFSKIYEYR